MPGSTEKRHTPSHAPCSRVLRVNIGFLSIISTYVGFNVAKYRNCFDKDFDPTDLRDITPNDQETILRYLSLLYAKLMDAAQEGKDIKGDILEGVSDPEQTGMNLDMPERIAYFACLMTYSILMGKTQEIPGSQVRSVTVISPLLLWSHEFDASALFDGTGEFFPYPKDSCTIAPATIPPRQVLNFKLLPVSGNKLKHRKAVEQSPERYYPRMEKLFSSILTALSAKYQQIYVCTWKDKISDPYEYRTLVPMSQEVRIEKITHIEDEHHFDIEPVLKFERFLKTLVEKLKLSDRVFVSHYGLTRGSNQFISFDCVLLVGNFYYPSFAYADLSTFSKIFSLFKQTSAPTYNGEALPILLSHLIQECLRTRARKGKLVDCYLCLDATDRDYKEIFGGLQTLQDLEYYVNSIETSDLNGEVIASEYLVKFQYIIRDLLTKKQEDRMVKLAETYPELLANRELDINTVELGRLWKCRSNDVCPILQTIMERSKALIAYQILESGKHGRHNSAKLRICLRSIE